MSFWKKEGAEMHQGDKSEDEDWWTDSSYFLEVEFM